MRERQGGRGEGWIGEKRGGGGEGKGHWEGEEHTTRRIWSVVFNPFDTREASPLTLRALSSLLPTTTRHIFLHPPLSTSARSSRLLLFWSRGVCRLRTQHRHARALLGFLFAAAISYHLVHLTSCARSCLTPAGDDNDDDGGGGGGGGVVPNESGEHPGGGVVQVDPSVDP